jgi:hypothetical protein
MFTDTKKEMVSPTHLSRDLIHGITEGKKIKWADNPPPNRRPTEQGDIGD